MAPGVRGKLFLTSLALMFVVGLPCLVFLERGLRHWMQSRVESELVRQVAAARILVEEVPGSDRPPAADALADRLGRASGARVTIIDHRGVVVGDSQLDQAGLATLENHLDRPEIARAAAEGKGVALRYSTTMSSQLLYVAMAFSGPSGDGVVRVAMPLSDVDAVVDRLRLFLLLAGGLGLGVAIVMSGLASSWAARALLPLVEHARAVASGRRVERLQVASRDELGLLAGSFNRLTEDLDSAVAALASERDWLETMLQSMGEAVIALDESDRIQRINQAALSLLGVTEAERGRPVVELVRSPAFADLLPQVREQGSASAELTLPTAPPRQVLARGAALEANRGVVIVMLDVTETRRLENVRRDFVANVSHELRTPISVIRANADTLLEGALQDPNHGPAFVEAIQRNAARLSSIVSDLLDLARLEAQLTPLQTLPVSVSEVVERLIAAHSVQADTKKVHLMCNVPSNMAVRADRSGFEQILGNLLDNAIKYTAERGTVELIARAEGQRVVIEVRDDGPGIERRHRERIFERFYRVDAGRSREVGGTGLGLSIVKHLAEAMGAKVTVDDNSPKGSVFRVQLPAA